jgi:mannose-1-phosphate guanylyltransferase
MQALLLCAGLGTRLEPLTRYFPKCLTPIQGRPLLGIWLETLVNAGFTKILINLHYLPELVREFVQQTHYAKYIEWLDEPELLGTAGTLIGCRSKLSDAPLLLVHADNLSQFSLESMWQSHLNAKSSVEMTMMTFTTDDPSGCGIVEQDSTGAIIAFHEKVKNPPSNFANGAVYILSRNLIDRLDSSITDFTTEVVEPNLGNIQLWHNSHCHRDIGTVSSLLQAPADLITPLTSPVTDFWRQFWSRNRWQRLYGLAQQMANDLGVMFTAPSNLPQHGWAGVLIIEQFSQEQWSVCLPRLDRTKSIVLIGEACPQALALAFKNDFQRYVLFVASNAV